MDFECKKFHQLSLDQLYELLQLRSQVFVVEQTCYYQDIDDMDRDPLALHLLGYHKGVLVAYLRILPQGTSYPDHQSIGRVVTSDVVRGQGAGHKLLARGIEICVAQNPTIGIKISAQEHLQKYYCHHRFVTVSEVYLEDDINHVAMIRLAED